MNSNFNNIEPKSHQQKIYNNLTNKDFKTSPYYSNWLTKDNSKIKKENLILLEKLSKITKYCLVSPLEILYKEQYDKFNKISKEREKCSICLTEFYDDIIDEDTSNFKLKDFDSYYLHEIDTIKLFKCEDHFYHIECLLNFIQEKIGFKCAICQKIYGIIEGNMPPGIMSAYLDDKIHCSGYPNVGTIVIKYSFKNGILNNGKHYSETARTNYIPNTKNGRILLGLLKIAFDRKLTFTVGTSVTTGVQNSVVWNGIHHKSYLSGGAVKYGYPDPSYFNRVCQELASKGVNKDDFDENSIEFLALNLMYGN